MEQKMSTLFTDLIRLQTLLLDTLSLQFTRDKKIIEIRYKSEVTSILMQSYDKSIKKF